MHGREGCGQNCISEEVLKKMEPGPCSAAEVKAQRFTWDIRKSCFALRAAKRWNRLTRVFLSSACFEGFKTPLN